MKDYEKEADFNMCNVKINPNILDDTGTWVKLYNAETMEPIIFPDSQELGFTFQVVSQDDVREEHLRRTIEGIEWINALKENPKLTLSDYHQWKLKQLEKP